MSLTESNKTSKRNKWIRIILNKYLISSVLFAVWMLFFDQNSYLIHRDLDKQVRELKRDKKNYTEKLKKERARINQMKNDSTEIERVAREKHFLKKEGEDIFIVEERKVGSKEGQKNN